MKDEHAHIIATCAQCNFRFDILRGVDCPRCRMEAVKAAFAPIDPLRTALGIGTLHTNVDWQSAKWRGVKERADAAMNQDGTWEDRGTEMYYRPSFDVMSEQQTEVPRGFKVPLGDAAQTYELRRMFRR